MGDCSFSGVRLVTRAGAALLTRCNGYADIGALRPWTADTRSQVASISKQFAAAVALLLTQHERLNLADRVTDLLPDAPAQWAGVCVQQLLTHTSGMSHWGGGPGFDPAARLDPRERLRMLLATPPPDPPGRLWRYSSPGYIVLSALLERAAQRRYQDLVRELIIDPLALTNTTVGAPADGAAARGYRHGVEVIAWDVHAMPGTGDIWSTATDIARFIGALHSGALLGAEAQKLFHEITVPHDGAARATTPVTTKGYGLGHFTGSINGEQAYLHPGDNPGYQSLAAWLPASDTVIVALGNEETDNVELAVAELLGDRRIGDGSPAR